MGMPVTISGVYDEKFAKVADIFETNFAERGEVGAAVSLYVEGECVVDLWAGSVDVERSAPWQRDTLVQVFSATKGLAGACMHLLIDRGLLDVHAPVAKYWPEFAQNGKEAITVGMVLSHQAGLPHWEEPVPRHGLMDWDFATSALARQAPVWEPGTCHGYHGMTSGFIWGEILRRITGRSIGDFLRDELAEPLGADVWMGLPESEEERVSHVILAEFGADSAMFAKAMAEPDWYGAKMLSNCGDLFAPDVIHTREFRAMIGPATSGTASAAGLARFYAPFSTDGSFEGRQYIEPASLAGMRAAQSVSGKDLILRIPTSFTWGLSKTWGRKRDGEGNYMVLGENAFGTPGMGGSMGFADTDARLAFGYVMNQLGQGVALNARGQGLIDAAYETLGFSTDAPGFWTR